MRSEKQLPIEKWIQNLFSLSGRADSNDRTEQEVVHDAYLILSMMQTILKPPRIIILTVGPLDNQKPYEFLEHTADAYIAAYGKDLAEAFENAAIAMFDVMTEVEMVNPKIEDSVTAEAEDELGLLYNWLEALLIRFETHSILYSKFKIQLIGHSEKNFKLQARIWGEKFNAERHLQKVGVKAITYHRMEITKEAGRVTLKFILDI